MSEDNFMSLQQLDGMAMTSANLKSCNTLLTQLALVVAQLESLVLPYNNIVTNSPLTISSDHTAQQTISHHEELKWYGLLIDLKIVVLPEFYVVFNDSTTLATARQRLYELTQKICHIFQRYLDASNSKQKSSHPISKEAFKDATDLKDNPFQPLVVDDYINGRGPNAQIAVELQQLAQLIAIDGVRYIEAFEPYYELLLKLNHLKTFLRPYTQLTLTKELEQWQRSRFIAFSIIDKHNSDKYPNIMNSRLDHALAGWMLKEVLGQRYYPKVLKQEKALVRDDTRSGVALGVIVFVSVILGITILSISSPVAAFSFGMLVGFPSSFLSLFLLSKKLNFYDNYKDIKVNTSVTTGLAFIILFFGMPWTMIALNFFILSIGLKVVNNVSYLSRPKLQIPAKEPINISSSSNLNSLNNVAATSERLVELKDKPKNDTIMLMLNTHAYHLGLLLSSEPTEQLRQLIVAINELTNHLTYLNTAHPYLATRVREHIKDLSQNTIVRLDKLASNFVDNDKVDREVQALFIRQHETRINELITLNLKQVQDLNITILEKQMAVFNEVGSKQESLFRNTVMELKILLRWLIAQHSDNLESKSHQVILDQLESTTLMEMQIVFFDNKTTTTQREALSDQIETLLNHFKLQSSHDIASSDDLIKDHGQQTVADLSDLLNLSKSAHKPALSIEEVDTLNAQQKTQHFIDFNQVYVNQLVKHWH